MDLDQLQTFLAVLEHGSFSRAAEARGVGQSTVSFHIKALETAAGAKLLDRRGGSVRLTAPGKILRHYAQRIVSMREEALGRLRAEEAGESGRVVINASSIPAEYLLPPVLADLRAKHPNVSIKIDVSDSRVAIGALLQDQCDVALVGARVRDKRLTWTPFADDGVVLVAPNNAEWAPGNRLAPKDLAGVPLVLREEGSGTRATISALIEKYRDPAEPKAAEIEVGSTEAAKRCVGKGLGLSFISRRAIEDELERGSMEIVDFPGTPVRRSFFAVRQKSVTPPAPVRSLINLLVQRYR